MDDNNTLIKICFKKNSENIINNKEKCLPVKLWLKAYFNGNQNNINFNLKLEGTEFQETVWQALLKIPWGKTISYKALAEKIGRPKAYRAVGNALNKNPYSPKVPCHRVINSNGFIGGFAKGTIRIINLLKKEKIEIKENRINLKKYLWK